MNTEFVGKRCRVRSLICDNATGASMRGLTGTIRRQVENLGRTLLLVDWDGKEEATFVFPSDINILEEENHSSPINFAP